MVQGFAWMLFAWMLFAWMLFAWMLCSTAKAPACQSRNRHIGIQQMFT
jgi:hypothetical protein